MVTTDRNSIDQFLDHKRLAVVGVSRNANDFSRMVFRAFQKQGYDVVPVNPGATEMEGKCCFAHVGDIQPPVDAALLFTQSRDTAGVVDECVSAGIHHVWMHRGGGGPGAVNPDAVAVCREHAINLVAGECPMMFLRNNAWFHRFHGLIRKIAGTYPN